MSDIDLDHPTRGIDWRRTPGPQIRSRLVVLADAVKAAEAERDAYRAALQRILDHGKTHDEPCYAIQNGDCADVMQEIARAVLGNGETA